jgi:uncharacterized protein DUF6152
MIRPVLLSIVAISGMSASGLLFAHHSYSDFELESPFEFTGTVTEMRWQNPHILFDLKNGSEVMRIEWITIAGANKTGVTSQRIQIGDQLTVIGSRNRNPALRTMAAIRELLMPAKHWQWKSPSETRTNQ